MDTPHNVRLKRGSGELYLATPGHESYLAYIRRIVADLARQIGFTEEEVAKIEMAVDEACSNVVEHAYAKDKEWSWKQRDPEIRLQVRVVADDLIIEINDHGQRFDFGAYRPSTIEESLQQMKRGGYGISIMRQFMDEVQYHSSADHGNTLRLIKHLKRR